MVATSPRNRYRTRYKVSAEKPRSSELRLSPTRANCSNQTDFLSLFGLRRNIPQPKDTCIESSRLRLCSVVIMCSRCDICDRWFKSSWDVESHISRYHDEFEMALVRKSIMKRRNKVKKGRSMDKENRTVKRNRLPRKVNEDFELALGQLSDLESAVAADKSQFNGLPKTSVKKSKKTVEFKPRIVKRPLLLPPNLLQARMASPSVDDDSDDEIQFCCEVKYNRETTVQSDDDCEVVCEVVKDKTAPTTPEPVPKYFQDPRISSTDSFKPGLRHLVDPSQLCYVVTRCNDQEDDEKVVAPVQESRSKVSSTSSTKFRAYNNNVRTLSRPNPVFNVGRNTAWDKKIKAYVEKWRKAQYEKANLEDNEIVILQDHENSYDSYMNAGRPDNKQLECDSTDEIVILS